MAWQLEQRDKEVAALRQQLSFLQQEVRRLIMRGIAQPKISCSLGCLAAGKQVRIPDQARHIEQLRGA